MSFRRVAKRSDSDPRDAQLDPEVPGEDARGSILSTLVLPPENGDPVVLPVPIRLPIPGLEASDGCGKLLVENELDRSEAVFDSNLRKLGEGDWLAGGLGGLNDLLEPKEGLEGRDGADLGWVNEGLGWLNEGLGRLNEGLGWLNDGLGRLKDGLGDGLGRLNEGLGDGLGRLTDGLGRLTDGLGWLELPANDLCWKLDIRLSDLSRPSARPPTMDEINATAVTTATAARDRIVLFFHILLLLPSGIRPRQTHDT